MVGFREFEKMPNEPGNDFVWGIIPIVSRNLCLVGDVKGIWLAAFVDDLTPRISKVLPLSWSGEMSEATRNDTWAGEVVCALCREFEDTGGREVEAGNCPREITLCLVGTPFQRKVLRATFARAKVDRGLFSYLDIARDIGCSGGVRAVGSALGRNNLTVLIPCHLVFKTGAIRQWKAKQPISLSNMGGYRWGVETKLALLSGLAGQEDDTVCFQKNKLNQRFIQIKL